MMSICPDATIVDISHEVTRHSITEGARILVCALPYFPVGIHVAVVDPGVGTQRVALAIRTNRGDVLIGPDNGLLVAPSEALDGIDDVRAIEKRSLMLPEISSSFHGRDIFAPVAAHLATGVPFEDVGPRFPVDELVRLPHPRTTIHEGVLETEITHVSLFGNVMLAASPSELETALGPLEIGQTLVVEFGGSGGKPAVREVTTWERTFGHVETGASVLLVESEGQLSFADNQGDAARRLELSVGEVVRIRANDSLPLGRLVD
jgi:S-adenosylmethionine hydrolase